MTADHNAAGAASHGEEGWHSINWKSAYRIVCRLQARIVKALPRDRGCEVKTPHPLGTGKSRPARGV